MSSYHLNGGGDLIWQLGTAYFGCRTPDGRFDPVLFAETAVHPKIKLMELKLSQGGKPGYGGVLPSSKVSPEIAAIRGVRVGERVVSPPSHPGIESARDLLRFVQRLRDLSGNKPVGIKLCVGNERELVDLTDAMRSTGIAVDYIVVDGAEAGTGAAPLEFANHVGTPLEQGLVLVVDTLRRLDLRDRVRVFASGRVLTGFDMFRASAHHRAFRGSGRAGQGPARAAVSRRDDRQLPQSARGGGRSRPERARTPARAAAHLADPSREPGRAVSRSGGGGIRVEAHPTPTPCAALASSRASFQRLAVPRSR